MARFFEMLNARWDMGARVCIGPDPVLEKMPIGLQMEEYKFPFCREIVNATADLALAYKPNLAFWTGAAYPRLLELIEHIRRAAPGVPVVLDGKRGDVYDTNAQYAAEAFDYFGADALTVNPYVGGDALQPFFDRADKDIFVLCKTSNPGADEFQDLWVNVNEDAYEEITGIQLKTRMPLYQYVAHRTKIWDKKNNNCALVVGATYPEELDEVRDIIEDMWLLIPGVGKQGGNLAKAVQNAVNRHGRGFIISSSSGIIHASSSVADFAACAREATMRLTIEINAALP